MKNKHVIKEDKNFIDFLKELTSFLFNKNNNDIDNILNLIKYYDVNKYILINKIFNYFYNKPKIIFFLNRYFNNLFEFNSYDIKMFLLNMKNIIIKNKLNFKDVSFIKSDNLKDVNKNKILDIFKNYYFYTKSLVLSHRELNNLYDLYLDNIFTNDDISLMSNIINGEDIKLDPNNKIYKEEENLDKNLINNINQEKLKEQKIKEFSELGNNFLNDLMNLKNNLKSCKSCKFKNNNLIFFDIKDDSKKVDIVFLNTTSYSDKDILYKKPCCDSYGDLLRSEILKLPDNVNWAILNTIPCITNDNKKTKSQKIFKTDKNYLNYINKCSELINEFYKKYNPDVIVPLGKIITENYNIKGSIIQLSGKIFDIDNYTIIPLISPYIFQINSTEDNRQAWSFGWSVIHNGYKNDYENEIIENVTNIDSEIRYIQNNDNNNNDNNNLVEQVKNTSYNKKKKNYLINIPSDKILHKVPNNMTLFDIMELDNNTICKIFIDINGKKHYLLDEYKIPIYIKEGDYNNCNYLINNYDHYIELNGFDLKKLREALSDNIHNYKKKLKKN
jgi:uracil-DNA glycosylase